MEILPETYTRGSKVAGIFTHTQLVRDEHKALYEVKHATPGREPHVVSYELFRVKVQKEQDVTFGGVSVHYDAKEALPGDSQFGKWAWSYSGVTREEALAKYEALRPLGEQAEDVLEEVTEDAQEENAE